MIWLDFKIFGNCHGLKSPYFDDTFFWLVDTKDQDRNPKNGRFYKWIGGLGAQLNSFEWFMPAPGTQRNLSGFRFKVFNARRQFLRVNVAWGLCTCGQITHDDLAALKKNLQDNS